MDTKNIEVMSRDTSFKRITATTTIISGIVALVSLFIVFAAIDFNFDVFEYPLLFLTAGEKEAGPGLLRVGWYLDVFGYYLLLVPATIYLWYWLKPKSPGLVSIYTVFGLFYILIGAIGATILAEAWFPLISAYGQTTGQESVMIEMAFQTVTSIAFVGLFGMEAFPSGIWWLGIGLILRKERRSLGVTTVVLGIAALLAGIGRVTEINLVETIGLNIYLFMAPIWAIWLGVIVARRSSLEAN